MDANIIRAIIFFIAGLILILFPKKVLKFQIYVIKKFRIKYDAEKEREYHRFTGTLFLVIGVVLLLVGLG